MININARSVRNVGITGIQRYAVEVINRFREPVREIDAPNRLKHGVAGHLWEQCILPTLADDILWSPSNLGPLLYKNQVVTIHDMSVFDNSEWFSPNYVSLYRNLQPKLAKSVSHIITDSEFSKERIIAHLKVRENKVSVVKLAASDRFCPLDTYSKEKFKQDRGLPERFYLMVGSLEPRKNIEQMLRAWTVWKSRPLDLHLVIIGESGKVFSALQLSSMPPNVHFTGRIADADLPKFYGACESFIFPSLYEGFGLPPLEAMSCGVPVLCSNTTSLPEVVGNAAILFNPHLITSITNALTEMSEDDNLRASLSIKGIERAKKFNWDSTSGETMKILQEYR